VCEAIAVILTSLLRDCMVSTAKIAVMDSSERYSRTESRPSNSHVTSALSKSSPIWWTLSESSRQSRGAVHRRKVKFRPCNLQQSKNNMRVGILGSGLMGGKLGTIFARAGHEVVFSYARSKDKLKKLASDAQGNARAGTPSEAAKEADALLLAVHWSRIDDVLKQAGDLSNKVIVTCSLPMDVGNTGLVVAHTSSGAEELAKKANGARVVSAFNSVPRRSTVRSVRSQAQVHATDSGGLRRR
jgi:predicted dinucleotide-binding enzyme